MRRNRLFLLFFFASGATGLVYEVLWVRMLSLVFGSTTFAVSTVLVAFMAGLALGAFVFGRDVDRRGRPVFLYGILEVGIGCCALFVPWLLDVLTPGYRLLWQHFHLSFFSLTLFRFLLATAILLVPTTLMGGTLPVLSKFYTRRRDKVGLSVGLLYAVNTVGAVVGAVLAGFLLLPAGGMGTTNLTAVLLNLSIGVAAVALARSAKWEGRSVAPHGVLRSAETVSASRDSRRSIPSRTILVVVAAFALSGFVAMVYEVAWSRLLTLVLGSSTYAFTTMVATFLAGLALGSSAMARFADRVADPVFTLARLQIGIGVFALLGQWLFNQLPYLFLVLFGTLSDKSGLFFAGPFLLSALVMLPATLLLGAVFPLVIRICTDNLERVGRSVGTTYAANTLGTVLGAFAAGFLLLPTLGIQKSVTLGVVTNLLLGLVLLLIPSGRFHRMGFRLAGSLGLLFLIPSSIFYAPQWNPLLMSSGVYKDAPLYLRLYASPEDALKRITEQYKLLFYEEGPSATAAVVERPSLSAVRHLTLSIDGKVDASTAADMSTQVLSAHLPLLLAQDPRHVLVVGWASGITVGSATLYPVEEIVGVEIEPAVIRASRFFNEFNHEPLRDPRVRLVIDDARSYLLLNPEKYDVIISEPSNPWMSGPSRLFTREFFLLGRERLRPGGVFAQWLQLYRMSPANLKILVRTFYSVFSHVHIFQTAEGDLVLLGWEGELNFDHGRIEARLGDPRRREDLKRVNVMDPLDLLARWRLGHREIMKYAGEGPLNTDDNALIEFAAPKSMYAETTLQNLEQIKAAGEPIIPYLAGPDLSNLEHRAGFYRDLALRFLLSAEPTQARWLIQEALKIYPSADAYWLAGQLEMEAGNPDEIPAQWPRALAMEAGHHLTRLSLARYHQSWADFDRSEQHLAPLLGACGPQALARYLHGVNLYYLGRFQQAAGELGAALNPGLAGETGSPDFAQQAEEAFLRLGAPARNELAHYYLSLAYLQMQNQKGAARHMRTFLEELEAWRWQLELDPLQFSRWGLLEDLKTHEQRGIYLEEEIKLAQLVEQQIAAFLTPYAKGVTLYLLGYHAESIEELEASLENIKGSTEGSLAHYFLGLAYRNTGDYRRAEGHLESFLTGSEVRAAGERRVADARSALEEIRALLKKEAAGSDRRRLPKPNEERT